MITHEAELFRDELGLNALYAAVMENPWDKNSSPKYIVVRALEAHDYIVDLARRAQR